MLSSPQSELIKTDTIAAIASAHGQGAIGVIRISGAGAAGIVKKFFFPLPKTFESHKMYYGNILDIDEVMICYFKSPRSFTREDCVEIFCHGGMFVLSQVLSAVIENGARLAEPGEFTKRAFLNGRINLSQAEAVMDLISAKSNAASRAALRMLGGGLSRRIETARDRILSWLAHIELSIDYPEHEEEARNANEILGEGGALISDLRKLCETVNTGRIIREGIRTAIIGRPNVGKSTLLNTIMHENRAIVHETAGTTRDVLTEEVRVCDIPLVITDTAGLRETDEAVEKIGIEKTYEAAENAELILFVADATCGITAEDEEIFSVIAARNQIRHRSSPNLIVLMNKYDLKSEGLPCARNDDVRGEHINISAKTGEGLDALFARIKELFLSGSVGNDAAEYDIITRERHRVLLDAAILHVEKAMGELTQGVPEDLVSVSLRAAYIALGEILGLEIGDDIVDRIFSEFCVGK
ncbi:MAG: tRNA uridine-5-carboxymethylaminomethyl(34) synthesis GTPase MnmE [Clostridiales bacterium]|jgi:tRNA modification GTPase|nr:tRNA uridine-5-carboxymethylaminomethyl(34) synthesis GTPase MnmE [Clostridiales bacterium]